MPFTGSNDPRLKFVSSVCDALSFLKCSVNSSRLGMFLLDRLFRLFNNFQYSFGLVFCISLNFVSFCCLYCEIYLSMVFCILC